MVQTDPRIDAFIASAAPFAQPILAHLRALVHGALPDCVETIKWGMPHFTRGREERGRHGRVQGALCVRDSR